MLWQYLNVYLFIHLTVSKNDILPAKPKPLSIFLFTVYRPQTV